MRIRIPLIPLVITVNVEWGSQLPHRWRMGLGASLVLVALAALAILPWAANRREHCHRRIIFHAVQENGFLRKLPQYERRVEEARRANVSPLATDVQTISEYLELASYHRDQKIRFERGMSYPWLSVSPDPRSMLSEDELSDSIRKWEKEYRKIK